MERKHTVILDGAMGTELGRRGVDIGLPLWSTHALIHAPHVVRNIHTDYLRAGADVLTTNTFRSNIRALRRAHIEKRWDELNLKAVEFAFEARERFPADRPILIAGSIGPVEDCYRPDLVPSDRELADEHGRQAEILATAGVDFLLAETMNTVREAVAAASACAATGKEFAVSFVCNDEGRLLSGEPIDEAVAGVVPSRPTALLVNCITVKSMHRALEHLRSCSPVPIGCYPNVGTPQVDGRAVYAEVGPDEFVREALRWRAMGARLLGGCCGTTPDWISALVCALATDRYGAGSS
ncbi:MAG: homocysteine S-methyltransferase family protein [Bacteroidota bacterium]|nr:homocysteine S-methyltransferase family protein [Bacteroidota bacterium]